MVATLDARLVSPRLRGLVQVLDVWFNEDPVDLGKCDMVHYHQRSRPTRSADCLYYCTILIPIDLPPAELLAQMRNGTAQQIRRAAAKDQITCTFLFPPTLEDLDRFHAFYDQDATDPEQRLDRGLLDMLAGAGMLALSTAVTADGTLQAWHAYICHRQQGRARCDLSKAAQVDPEDAERRNLMGRLNRLLHFQDMLALREAGFKQYDFGGWYAGTEDPKRLNINRFKEGFGGAVVREYDFMEPVTWLGHGYLRLRLLKWFLFDREKRKDFDRRRLGREAREAAVGTEGPQSLI
jgi:hypothetical protein